MNRVAILAFTACILLVPSARAGSSTAAEARRASGLRYFTDVELVNQYGRKMRLYSDLIEGKVVIIDGFFTSCAGACPVMNHNMERIQEWLGDRLGRDVSMISISVDPLNDTPEKLRDYAERFHARKGWYFLTGPKDKMDFALKRLGQPLDAKENHTNLFVIGNEATGLWKKAFGLASAEDLIKIIQSVLDDRPRESAP